jgi:hypothetical protein
MDLFRCMNENCAGFKADYESADGECPTCHGFLALPLVTIHYLVPAAGAGTIPTGIGNRMVACDPKRTTIPQSTGVRSEVNCPKCRASTIFAEDEADGTDNHVPVFERIAAGTIGRAVKHGGA